MIKSPTIDDPTHGLFDPEAVEASLVELRKRPVGWRPEMSEPKLCPMRKEVISDAYRQVKGTKEFEQSRADVFLPCIQETCAWWVSVNSIADPYDQKVFPDKPHTQRIIDVGHCVALDWGKK